MIAALQMYDWPEFRAENDAFWHVIRDHLRQAGLEAPDNLARGSDLAAAWRDPGLLLGQTCGMPLVMGMAGSAPVFARPVYDVEGCGNGTYRSAILTRQDQAETLAAFQGARVAVNDWHSQSGYNTLAHAVVDLTPSGAAFFGDAVISGAHRISADMVAAGEADLCALDAVAWALYQRVAPEHAHRLKVIGWTAEAPTLPYITSPAHAPLAPHLLAALAHAAAECPPCPALPVSVLPTALIDYQPVRDMIEARAGYAFVQQK